MNTEYAAPTNEIEAQLVKTWQELLKVSRVGINDNFIELGGHSLLVMDLVLRIQNCFGIEIPLWEIFNRPTIAQIARLIQNREDRVRRFAQILAEIEALKEEEVQALLPGEWSATIP